MLFLREQKTLNSTCLTLRGRMHPTTAKFAFPRRKPPFHFLKTHPHKSPPEIGRNSLKKKTLAQPSVGPGWCIVCPPGGVQRAPSHLPTFPNPTPRSHRCEVNTCSQRTHTHSNFAWRWSTAVADFGGGTNRVRPRWISCVANNMWGQVFCCLLLACDAWYVVCGAKKTSSTFGRSL